MTTDTNATPPTDAEIREMLDVCEKATPPPWYRVDSRHGTGELYRVDIRGNPIEQYGRRVASTDVCTLHRGFVWFEGDADFIALARTAIPRLLHALAAERERCRGLREAIESRLNQCNCSDGMVPFAIRFDPKTGERSAYMTACKNCTELRLALAATQEESSERPHHACPVPGWDKRFDRSTQEES